MKKNKPLTVKLKSKSKYLRLLSGPPQTAGMRSGLVRLKSGEIIGEHSTRDKEEVLIILKGRAKIFLEKHPALTVRAGSLIYIPPHTIHNVTNAGRQLLEYVYIVAPVAS
jgi:quercetin dioxygenase-like cupin family protein